MTPEERAEKIYQEVAFDMSVEEKEYFNQIVVAQIREAEKEAQKAESCSHCRGSLEKYQLKHHRGCLCQCHEAEATELYAEGFNAAKEKAAKIATESIKNQTDQVEVTNATVIAMRIRQMEAE